MEIPTPKIDPSRWLLLDLETPFGAGIGYKLTPEEAESANIPRFEALVRPMSLLSLNHDDIAMIEGRPTAEFIIMACQKFAALQQLANDLVQLHRKYPFQFGLYRKELQELQVLFKEASVLSTPQLSPCPPVAEPSTPEEA